MLSSKPQQSPKVRPSPPFARSPHPHGRRVNPISLLFSCLPSLRSPLPPPLAWSAKPYLRDARSGRAFFPRARVGVRGGLPMAAVLHGRRWCGSTLWFPRASGALDATARSLVAGRRGRPGGRRRPREPDLGPFGPHLGRRWWWCRGGGDLLVVAASSAGEMQHGGRGYPDPFGSGRASRCPIGHCRGVRSAPWWRGRIPSRRLCCGCPRAHCIFFRPPGLMSMASVRQRSCSMTVVAQAGGRQVWWRTLDRPWWWWGFRSGEIHSGLSGFDAAMPAGAARPSSRASGAGAGLFNAISGNNDGVASAFLLLPVIADVGSGVLRSYIRQAMILRLCIVCYNKQSSAPETTVVGIPA